MAQKILVIDDSMSVRVALERLLVQKGYETVAVASAAEGLRRLTEGPFHLLISDLIMPEMDGVELVQLVRKNPALQGLPVILVSGLGDQEIEAKAAAVGADDVLRKPFTAETLIPKVERLLAKGARSSVRAPIPEGIPEVAISLDPIPLLRKLRSVAGVLGAALVERASGRVIASDGFDPGQADLAARHLAPLSPLLDPLGETTSHRNLRSIILQFGDGFVVVYRAGHVDVLLSLSDARQLGLLHYLVRKSLPDLLAS